MAGERPSSGREASPTTMLRRAGVSEPTRALALVAELEQATSVTVPDVPRALAALADPDAGLLVMMRLVTAAREAGVLEQVAALAATRAGAKAALVAGASTALGDFMVRHPHTVLDFGAWAGRDVCTESHPRREFLLAVGANPDDAVPVATLTGTPGIDAMRVAYRRMLMRLAGEDLFSPTPTELMPAVGRLLADMAGAALEAGLAIARAENPGHEAARLAIIGMGKCGARELNYVSDVDVIYVVEPGAGASEAEALAIGARLASRAAQACSAPATELPLWQVDANLRPEGKDGALVRGVASHLAYYERWAQSWEFQALLKARPVAGDVEVGRRYMDAVWPLVWTAVEREGFVESAQAMRRRVEHHIPAAESERELKLGPGGLRDVEFTIQLLQLVHGRSDESLRVSGTLQALAALSAGGYVGRVQADLLDASYRQLRVWEHRLQLWRLRRTHLMPSDEEGLRRLARASGMATVSALEEAWAAVRRDVRAMHLEMFYRPILGEVARLSADEAALDDEAARARLSAVGFRDPEGAQRHIAALTAGLSRRAAIQRQLLPAMIGWFAQGPDPDGGLLAFRQLSEQLEDAQWYLKLLRDSGTAAERLARLLSTSGFVTRALLASAQDITWLDNDEDLQSRSVARLSAEAEAIISRADDEIQCITALRGMRRREVVRAAAATVLGLIDSVSAAASVTAAADVLLAGALRLAEHSVRRERAGGDASAGGEGDAPAVLAIVAMGRFGGQEMGYTSDADVQFVYEARGEGAHEYAQAVAARVRDLLQRPNPQPALAVDADLRPEGKNGPLARSLDSSAEYYRRWSDPWEAQALLRARPVAGDEALCAAWVALVDQVRYPEQLTPAALKQMRTLKARMESERLPRGVDPRRHLKLGPGGLSDVEWTVQLLQMRHGRQLPALRTPQTLAALDVACTAEVLAEADAEALRAAWSLATDLRGAIALRGGSADVDVLPREMPQVRVLAEIMDSGESGQELDQRYARLARRARAVVERVFFGWEAGGAA